MSENRRGIFLTHTVGPQLHRHLEQCAVQLPGLRWTESV